MLTEPLKHQKDILKVLQKERSYGLLWDMGTGKTWLGCYLIELSLLPDLKKKRKSDKKYLVLCPNSMTDVWAEEIDEHTQISEERVCVLRGSAAKRRKMLDKGFNIYIINYEGLRILEEELTSIDWEIVIADESQRIKNPKATQTQIACAAAKQAKHSFILSGTPVTNSYVDIYSQWYFMGRQDELGINKNLSLRAGFYVFRKTHFEDKNMSNPHVQFSNWQPIDTEHKKTIQEGMKKGSHRLEKDDCLKLPPKDFQTLRCDLSAEQAKAYVEIKKECVTFLNSKKAVTAQQAIVKMLRLNQITSGFVPTDTFDDSRDYHEFKSNPKLSLLKTTVSEILENPKNKIIIWAHFRHDIELLTETLKKYNPVTIYGGVKDRKALMDKFQTDKTCRIFIGQPRSAGLGLTLTKANYTIYYSYNFNWEDRAQSEDRNHRKGSEIHKRITYINLICRETIDEAIIGALKSKGKMTGEIMDFIREGG